MPSRNTIEIIINATDNASRVFNSLSDNTQTIGKSIGLGLAAGIGVATTAITGFAVKGLQEFTKFQQGMQEVFSLLPGISQDAMDEMNQQVKDISERFGTLPEDVIPAFYEALSAGIPKDNVFEFVQTANKAAIAGVTDLATAVNGISSAMNAYGYDVLSAQKASDVMFQTVKLGKTTFEELSNSLYNVSPTAAALGVTFEDLNAQIAAITAQGVPTSVATNQMRQMFVELSKAGGKTADTFQQLAGKTFKQFIAEGGNTQDALQLLEKYAKETGVGINDLFSSVEAGSAALSLTGRNTERFTDFLDQMANAAGSTDAAFKTMSESLQFELNRTNAKFKILLVTVGEKLAPAFMRPIEVVGNLIGWFTDLLESGTSLTDFMSYDIPQAFRPFLMMVLSARDRIMKLVDIFEKLRSIFVVAHGDIDTFNYIVQQIFPDSVISRMSGFVVLLKNIGKTILKFIQPVIDWVKENVKLQDVLVAVGFAISTFVIPAIIAIGTALAPLVATFGVLVGGVTLLRKAWENDFGGIRTFVTKFVNDLKDDFMGLDIFETLQFVTGDILANIFGFDANDITVWLGNNLFDPLRTVFRKIRSFFTGNSSVGDILKHSFEKLKNLPFIQKLLDMFTRLKDALLPLFTQIGVAVSKIFEHLDIGEIAKIGSTLLSLTNPLGIIKLLFEKITGINLFDVLIDGINRFTDLLTNLNNGVPLMQALGIEDDSTINTIIQTVIDTITNLITFVQTVAIPALQQFGSWFLNEGLPSIVDFVVSKALPAIRTFFDWLGSVWETVRPALESIANWFINDALPKVVGFITGVVIPGIQRFIDIIVKIWNDVSPFLGKLFDWFVNDALPKIGDYINNVAIPIFKDVVKWLNDLWLGVQPYLQQLYDWFITKALPEIINFLETVVSPAIDTFIKLLQDIWTVVSPVIDNLLQWFIRDGLPRVIDFLNTTFKVPFEAFINLIKSIWTTVSPGLTNFKNGIDRIFGWIKTNVIDPIAQRIEEFIQTLTNLGLIAGNTQSAIAGVSANPGTAVTNPAPLFGANGYPYVPRDNFPMVLHKGERVLTKDENKAYTNNQNQSSSPMITIENLVLGDIQNQNDANDKARMFVNGLRAQGIEI